MGKVVYFVRLCGLGLVLSGVGLLVPNQARTAADAMPSASRTASLAALLEIALKANPEIRAARDRYQAMLQRPIQEGTLPDPSLGVRYHNEQFGRLTFGSSEFSFLEFSAEQGVPFPGKLRLKASAASRAAERERAMLDLTVCSVLAKVVQGYANLSVADRATEILNESVGVLDTILKQTGQSYSVGTAAQQDLLRATLERDALRERIAMLAQDRTAAEAALDALLNRPSTEPFPKSKWSDRIPELEPLDKLTARLDAQGPELRAAAQDVARSQDELQLARRGYFPDFTLMGAYADKNGLFAEWEAGARMTVPLYFWRRQTPALAEATFNERAAEHTRLNRRVSLESELRELHKRAETALKLINLYSETLIPEAALTFESARASYAVGKVDFLSMLNAFGAVLEYKFRYTDNVGEFRRAVAAIGPLVGKPPYEARQAAGTQ